MKFLLDVHLPPALCGWRRARGHDADRVGTPLNAQASDTQIVAFAAEDRRVVISKDEDFARLLTRYRFQLVWLHCGNTATWRILGWLEPHWEQVERLLSSGEQLIERI